MTDAFVLLSFLLYVAVSVLFSLRVKPAFKRYVSGSLVFGLPVAAFALHASLVGDIEYALAISALGFGLFYAVLGWALYLSRRDSLHLLAEAFAALAVIFASFSIPLAFDGKTTTAMWAIEGGGLLWLGVRQQRLSARVFALLLQLFGACGLLAGIGGSYSGLPVFNRVSFGIAMLTVAALFSGYWLRRGRDHLKPYERHAATAFGLWGIGWWLFGGV